VPGGTCPIGGQAAIAGLEFVEGSRYGAPYAGALFFADYARGCIFAMPAGAGGVPNAAQIIEVMPAETPVDLELGRDGFLYYVDILGGSINRIVRNSGGGPPLASLVANKTAGPLPLTVTFDASGSTDPDGTAGLTYAWDLDGNGTFETPGGATRQHTFMAPKRVVDVGVRVTDPTSQSATATVRVFAGYRPPTVQITAPATTQKWAVGQTINFAATSSDPDDGALPASAFEWSVRMLHCPTGQECHVHLVTGLDGARSGSVVGPDHEMTTKLELVVTVTDPIGLTATASRVLNPRTVSLTVRSQPFGAELSLNGQTFVGPRTQAVIKGSTNSVTASASHPNGTSFLRWSDAGARSHLVNPTVNTTLTATYR
jgi:hypothetical protein